MVKGSALSGTNILIGLFSGGDEAKLAIETQPPRNAISLTTWMEAMVGAGKYHQEARTRIALSALSVIGVLRDIAERSASIRQGHGMKLPDAIILAAVQIHHLALIT